ncbi:MAG TPA: 4Fe-4S dicluster domain-containing protein [Bacilli bacterium]|nr:4Fe-4S dicluster domain-containing protein [Bacilli bacterium]
MNNMISVNDYKSISVEKKVRDFLNPDYVYIPIPYGYSIIVKTEDHVFKEQVIIKGDKYIYSPVSGKVIGVTDSMHIHNANINCLIIENDFEERVENRHGVSKYINDFKKEEMLELIDKYQACDINFRENAKTLLINGIDKDPFERTRSFIINSYSDKLLETIDALLTILDVQETIFTINNSDTLNVVNVSNNIGTYPNIKLKLIPDIYPLGFPSILIKNVLSKREINDGVIMLNVEDVYNIYNVLKRKKPITEKLVTVSGNAIESPLVVNVKIGTSMADLIKNVCKVCDDNYFVVINGLIAGISLKSLSSVITSSTRSIFLSTKDNSKESLCINCGLCNSKCPVHLNPKYLREHKNADKSKCIHCGLCTYLCPSKINFKTYLEGDESHEK